MRGPVVNVPVVLVEEEVVLGEEVGGHGGEFGRDEGGEEEVGLEGAAFARLIYGVFIIMSAWCSFFMSMSRKQLYNFGV